MLVADVLAGGEPDPDLRVWPLPVEKPGELLVLRLIGRHRQLVLAVAVADADDQSHPVHPTWSGGFPYLGRASPNTLRIVAEEGSFVYCADSYADDLPYWAEVAGQHQLIVPYTLDANDMRFATAQGFNTGDQFFTYLRDSFDVLWREGEESPKMMSVGLHMRLAGRPGRFAGLQRFLDHVQRHDGVWVARRVDIARHWRERFLPPR